MLWCFTLGIKVTIIQPAKKKRVLTAEALSGL